MLEPCFVRRGDRGEDDGWLVGFGLTGDGPVFGVMDAKTMRTACALLVPGANALGLHGTFVPE